MIVNFFTALLRATKWVNPYGGRDTVDYCYRAMLRVGMVLIILKLSLVLTVEAQTFIKFLKPYFIAETVMFLLKLNKR